MFSERCELRKGLAVLDTRERQLNWKIKSKENYIRHLESLGAGPEKKDQVGTSSHSCCPCVDPPTGAVRPTRWSEPTCSGSTRVDWSSHQGLQGPSPAPPPDRPGPGWRCWRPRWCRGKRSGGHCMTNCRPTRRRLCNRKCRHQWTSKGPLCSTTVHRHGDGGGEGSDRECPELGPGEVTNEIH